MVFHENQLTGKIVLVAGADNTAGKELTIKLAQAGADIVVLGKDKVILDKIAFKVNFMGNRYLSIETGSISGIELEFAINSILAEMGKIDILVINNYFNRTGRVIDTAEENLTTPFQDNVVNYMLLAQTVASQHFIKCGTGKIIHLTATSGIDPVISQSTGNIVNAASIALTKSLALELAGHGISVNNIVADTICDSDSSISLPWDNLDFPPENAPTGLDEIVAAIIYLDAESANHISGQTLTVGKGISQLLAID